MKNVFQEVVRSEGSFSVLSCYENIYIIRNINDTYPAFIST
jgi:hypothetical protein